MQQERAGTEGIVAELGAKCSQLEKWLEENEWKAATLAGPAAGKDGRAGAALDPAKAAEMLAKLDVNKIVVPEDDLSRQALAAQAEDLAIEDALTVLDKALRGGKVPVDQYIKQVRLGDACMLSLGSGLVCQSALWRAWFVQQTGPAGSWRRQWPAALVNTCVCRRR